MNTSPDRPRRVLRGGHVDRVAPLSFPAVEHRVIRSPIELEAERQAAAARREAEQREQFRRQAAEQGYAEGHAAGSAQAMAEGRQAAAKLLGRVDAELAALASRRGRDLEELTERVADFAFEVVETLLGRELAVAASPGRDAVLRALRLAPEQGDVVVRLNPADAETLGDTGDLVVGRSLQAVADPAVEPGGCLLACGDTRVDAQLSSALERLRKVLSA